ncbi:MAG: sensor histidine kinase [Blautia sp.]|uniref:sensor histidine kinase n=1 Tax=Blautia sp. TaxID=1955243 RepID=UPI0025BF140D|nr:sensor histidine kinase [Blautia sp.]MCI7448746.1 sensor histidine kinase [Blautia sp.]
MESDMAKRTESKKRNGLKAKDSLMNKIFIVYMLLMFVSCVVLLAVFGLRFSNVYSSQAKAHMNDVTVAAETGITERISQIDQLSVSILINNTVQENLKQINYKTATEREQASVQTEKTAISRDIRGSVFNISGIVSVRIYSLDGVEIVIGAQGTGINIANAERERIYEKNGSAIWTADLDNGMIGLYRAILSVNDFKPIGYMSIECRNSYLSEKLQSVPSIYKNRFYLLNDDMGIIASSESELVGKEFPLTSRDFKRLKVVKDPCTGKSSYCTYRYMDNGWLLISTINVAQLWKNIGIAFISVLVTFAVVLFISLITMRYATKIMMKPTKKLVASMTAYQEGNFDSRFEVESKDEISQIGMVYNQLADNVQNLIEKNYTLEIANREAEIECLKMQINPHFLYNCLDTISWLGFTNGNSEVTDLAVALGKFLRASIKREDYYTVKQEMDVVDNYLFIQKYRFGDKIEIRHDIPEEVLDFYIPSFIIQPVIENSIVHGLEEQIEKGILWIDIKLCEEKYLQFTLSDNGKGMDEEQLRQVILNYTDKSKKSSIGLSNVYRRLNLLYGPACEFHITSALGKGTEVSFRTPVMEIPENNKLNKL